jgi:hypothetical protein
LGIQRSQGKMLDEFFHQEEYNMHLSPTWWARRLHRGGPWRVHMAIPTMAGPWNLEGRLTSLFFSYSPSLENHPTPTFF